jgi:hypothetical protein
MPKHEREPALVIVDEERNRLDLTPSRSGKRLIVTIYPRGVWDDFAQIQLDADQVEQVRTYLNSQEG